MQFLKTLFWVILAVVAVIFSLGNWKEVDVALWGGLIVGAKLPVLLFGAFLLGLVPTFVLHRATRWRLRKRLETTERALNDARGIPVEVPEERGPIPPGPIPPGSVPSAVPPGVA